jgi:hypothetical protein
METLALCGADEKRCAPTRVHRAMRTPDGGILTLEPIAAFCERCGRYRRKKLAKRRAPALAMFKPNRRKKDSYHGKKAKARGGRYSHGSA